MLVKVVRADYTDSEALARLDEEIFGQDAFSARDWEECLAFWIFADDERVGAMAVEPDSEPSARGADESVAVTGCLFLTSIGILAEYQKSGICSCAMNWLIAWAKERGFHTIVSNFRESNQASCRFHKKAGFAVVRRNPGYYENPAEDAIVVMRAV